MLNKALPHLIWHATAQNLQKTTDAVSRVTAIEPEKTPEKTATAGYFKDDQVKDRKLSDWSGTWQSVYPLLQKGDLDQVMRYKSLLNKDKTEEEYKAYYTAGYKSDVDKITIKKDTITFDVNGTSHKATYKYVGKEILNISLTLSIVGLARRLGKVLVTYLHLSNLSTPYI